MVAILPIHSVDVNQAEIDFIDQGAWLKAVAGAFAGHAAARNAMELVMHERNELIERRPISTAPREEQFR